MKRLILGSMISVVLFVFSSDARATDYVSQGDLVYKQEGLENYKQSIDLYLKALKDNPDSYEINWKLARSYRDYGEHSKRQGVAGWEDICAEYGKTGMKYGGKAIELNPEGVEGHYFYGLNVGTYSDGVSILTALRQGLKGKTQRSFEKAYLINKIYNEGGPMKALGRFWFVLPWPMNDKKKSRTYLRECREAFPENIEGLLYLGEVLLKSKKKDRAEARAILQKVTESDEIYFRDWAKRLLCLTPDS
ncbi:MAG: hypothetical protein GY864_12800 [Desulfobacterales bacterium]|nr:hypothetical protein [Desulfobacterales bacterium]